MSHYRSDLAHTEFLLYEVFRAETAQNAEAFPEIDRDTARDVLRSIRQHAHTKLAPSFAAADREGIGFDPQTGEVRLPEALRDAVRDHLASEWPRLDLPADLTDVHLPPSLRWAATEFVLGANPAVAMCTQLVPQVVTLLHEQGTPEQRRLAEIVLERHWGVTMVLTEADAGSDVGSARARAVPQPGGEWHVEGTKRFITWAEHDAAENVVHMVLARPQGIPGAGGEGTKGLSLFVVPNHRFDPRTGDLLGRNGVRVSALEKKMGVIGAPTCELTFGDDSPAVATLLGDRHEGLRQMFEIITYVRMMVGAKAAATLSSGYLNAREYAEIRVQGTGLPGLPQEGRPVEIVDHPDVRRSLLTQRSHAEGARALVLYTASQIDRIEAARHRGRRDAAAGDRHRLLLPIVKTWCAERSFQVLATESLQTLGGSGYTRDYPLEQYVRDTKIDAIYEGTTGIQGLDLLTRRLVRDKGAVIGDLLEEIEATATRLAPLPRLAEESGLLAEAAEALRGQIDLTLARAENDLAVAALGATALLLALGDLVVAWLLLRAAETALALLDGDPATGGAAADGTAAEAAAPNAGSGRAELHRRVSAGRWFARLVLPHLVAGRRAAALLDGDLVTADRAQF